MNFEMDERTLVCLIEHALLDQHRVDMMYDKIYRV